MFQGNWKCSTCGGAITELPFQPRSESGLTCRACYGKQKDGQNNQSQPSEPNMTTAGEAAPFDVPEEAEFAGEAPPAPDLDGATPRTPGERAKFSGDWKCAGCGAAITSLPFMPRSTENLKCIDCFKASKG